MWLSSHSTCILRYIYIYIIGTFSLKFIMIWWVLTFCHTNFVWGTVVLVTFSYSGEGGRPRAKQNKKKCNTLLTHTYRKKKTRRSRNSDCLWLEFWRSLLERVQECVLTAVCTHICLLSWYLWFLRFLVVMALKHPLPSVDPSNKHKSISFICEINLEIATKWK